jgi:threonylcarbamoyladenosine tRNA methylthiotransferase MtaB
MGKPLRKVEPEGMKSVAFFTIGCKLNQFETEQMREIARADGYEAAPSNGTADRPPDVVVINTCTVTSKSDYRSRQAVRRAVRSNPGALVIVTGCYSQLAAGEMAELEGVDVILGNAEKEDILEFLHLEKQHEPIVRVMDSREFESVRSQTRLSGFGRYTRAFVKIQDGCDNRCTYCAVPLARGRSRSKKPVDIVAEIEILAAEGYKEIVLTGVHLGSYGKDLAAPTTLAGLLRMLPGTPGLERIRLSSIEPTDFTDELIEIMSDPAMKICPHVHVPLQSGDDGVLRRMGRPYGRDVYENLIERIAGAIPDCGIGADVMVGFPGEDQLAFKNTYDLIDGLPVSYLHVFSFSCRPGTAARGMDGQVAPETKKQRSRDLRHLGRVKSREFRTALAGKDLKVLVLGSGSNGRATGLSGNYVKVYFDASPKVNTVVTCTVKDILRDGVLAVPSDSTAPKSAPCAKEGS